jgi:exonuclease SbcC
VRTGLESARKEREILASQHQAKLEASGGAERLAADVRDALNSKNEIETEKEELLKLLPPLPDRASSKLAMAERAVAASEAAEQQARQELDRKTAVLQNAQGEGYYSKLGAAEEERELAREMLQARLAQAQGAKVLRTLAHTRRERMNSGLMAPIEDAVIRIFDRIHGPMSQGAARLSFGSDLAELGVKVAAQETAAALDVLSLGTREQAGLALRLAFGELLSRQGENPEPQLVVLDDPLVNADPGREARALEVLSEAAKNLQILIFTARPENYRALAPKEYDLAALKNQTES